MLLVKNGISLIKEYFGGQRGVDSKIRKITVAQSSVDKLILLHGANNNVHFYNSINGHNGRQNRL